MILIIAEKPSLARNIAASIGSMKKSGEYFENDRYIVTWAFGHLFSLADVESYLPEDKRTRFWSMDNLPCFPDKFEFELKKDKNRQTDAGVVRRFEAIKSLCLRKDVDTIVNAGDSDREGEIIIRTCVGKTGVSGKSLKRLWMPDQTEETIRGGLESLHDESEYDNLAREGYARTFVDWLYGVNLTRYASLKTGSLMRVGRVIVPIVKAIYDRDMEIRHFVPDIYYAAVSKTGENGEIELTSKKKFGKNEFSKAQELCNKYNGAKGIVISKKKKKDSLSPGKLYSLTKLQNVLGKKYKMPMEESLKMLQGLYEKGYVTYPRTNSEYLADAEQNKMKKVISAAVKLGYPLKFRYSKSIFDDSKIESHSALTPTYKIPNKNSLSENEMKVYSTIMRRFAAVFCSEECIAEKNEIKIDVGGMEEFVLKGTVIISPGWTKYDDYSKKDKILPPLEKGDVVDVNFVPKEKETSPPRHYTIETLNNYLKNPFREDKANAETEDEEAEYRAMFEGLELGTEATRTGIIDNARKSLYIQLKKDVYTILPGGEQLIESLSRMEISMDKYKTSVLGQSLKKVYRGEISINDSVKLAVNEISEVFKRKDMPPETDTDDGFVGDEVGSCPLCGETVRRTKFGYGCSGYKNGCKFALSNVILGRVISVKNVKALLQTGKTSKIEGFVSKKTGKTFASFLKLENGRAVFDFG